MGDRGGTSESLVGLRVLDLSRVLAGPLCCQLLGDHGADVIKVEPPDGDDTRRWGPPFVADDMSAYFNAINRNKRNICLDLRTSQGHQVLERLLENTDVVVENFKAGTLARWGFSDERMLERHPRLIVCRITGFGADGPMGGMPGYDAITQAYGGLMSINGESEGPALRVGVPVVDMVTGIYAFSGILLALNARQRTGRGQVVDCTLVDTAVSLLHPHSASTLADGRVPVRTGSAHPTVAPYDTFEASDGAVFIGIGNDRQFRILVDRLGMPGLADDPRFRTNADRLGNLKVLSELLSEKIAPLTKNDLAQDLIARGVPASAIRDIREVLDDPHVRHREMVVERGDYRGIGFPIKLTDTPASVRETPRAKGADTHTVLTTLGYDDVTINQLLSARVVLQDSPNPNGKEAAHE
ncbi:CaiB/BaiF CoA transferase family protein [Amycolatopsis thermoflava]|uniref:CaiB/BaiF CoA transferase family protein n=1 Tax=Amycolatopsis thermoflava TaxID=84480 RepID=UPI000684C73D|nr:CoA transferase [Amycolatopsis thermoflava]